MKNTKNLFAVLSLIFFLAGVSAAQNVSLTNLDGGNFSLDAQRGKVVVLAVGATWLPLSDKQAIITNKLVKKYAGRDVEIYFVATDSTAAKSKNFASNQQIQDFAARNKMTAAILRDSDGATTLKRFKIDQLPAFVVFDKNGKVIGEPFGGVTPNAETEMANQISQAIDKIL